jgi:hypothetical protein
VKIIAKAIFCLFLVVGILTSCNGSVSKPVGNPTDVIATIIVTVKPTSTETSLATPTTTLNAMPLPTPFPPTQIPFFTFAVDRHDPESVIRAYFDAWERSDSSAMASVLSSKFGQNFMFEPLESMEILEIELTSDSSPTERIYSVLYDAQWKDQPDTNPIRWRFRLTWDANRDSWIIIGYGSG